MAGIGHYRNTAGNISLEIKLKNNNKDKKKTRKKIIQNNKDKSCSLAGA